MMRKKLVYPLITIILTISALSCESVVGPSTPAPEPTVTTYQGDWTGTTVDGLSVSFTVTGNTITSFCIDIRNANNVVISYASSDTPTISADGFNLDVKPPVSEGWLTIVIPIAVNGSFSSPTTVQGSATIQPAVAWTAQKN
ncbi:MAG: hypothetical protein MZV63_46950 [Marinilabiliales bacterium]|nr:hypothetical protein [Marinilabiliales bacterium]